jgi:hypothetical protein
MDLAVDKLRAEREQRIADAIALKIPDRVPFFPQTNFLAIQYAQISGREAFYDTAKWFDACKTMNAVLQPDLCWPPAAAFPGLAFDILGCTQVNWPGHGVPDHSSIQFIDREYLRAEEWDQFIDDPTDFILRTYLPRVFKTLTPLAKLPSFKSMFYHGYKSVMALSAFADADVAGALRAIAAAVEASQRHAVFQKTYTADLDHMGLVEAFSGVTILCPFDLLGDYFRGVRGIMLDMHRQPQKIIAAMEKIQPMLLQRAMQIAQASTNRRIFLPLHLGDQAFMSPRQFESFYWPYLKHMLLALIDAGFTPCPFFEGDYTSRLPYLAGLPRGKILGMFDKTDLFKAKEIIGGTMCLAGNVPVPLLQHGPIDDLVAYCKILIDAVGKDGGFVMSSRSVLDNADMALVEKWGHVTKEYGRY